MSATLFRLPEVSKTTGLSRSSIYRLAAAGLFPRPVKIGPRANAWRADEISAWVDQRTAARDSNRS